MADLKAEFQYYLENKESLLKDYENQYIVIKDRKILGNYPDLMTAVEETKKTHELGTFLVQHVTKEDEEVRFHSRAI